MADQGHGNAGLLEVGMSLKQIAIAIDQLANTLLGGYADETLSARAHRTRSPLEHWIDALFWDENHCRDSYQSELQRRQLPTEYRS
jgi:hypothetical protein